jgi:Zn-dependent protease/CBS domain-containing protein
MMSSKRITLFRLFGFEIKAEWSWLILAVWLTWSLADSVFPGRYGGLPRATYWWMGLAGALGLFASIVFHELWHALVARRYGIPIQGITLFIFGGVAELDDDPPSAKTEFLLALAGPASSAFLALAFHLMRQVSTAAGWPRSFAAVVAYLVSVNVSLAAFNILPAFPLDGGRVLRSVLWRWRGDIWWATRIASWFGSLVGNLLIGLGTLVLLLGDFVGSVWLIVVGLYLGSASRTSYQRLSVRQTLQGEVVERFMELNPVTVASSLSVAELAQDYVVQHQLRTLPVVDGSTLVGYINTREINQVPRAEWRRRTVGELSRAVSADHTIDRTVDAMKALSKMSQTGNNRLMVVDGDRLVGVVALKDLLKFLSLKLRVRRGFHKA